MAYDKNISPVGWYVASYLIRFVQLEDKDNEDLERRFVTWENTVIVKAESPKEAYEKVLVLANDATEPYLGGPSGVPVQWVFEGVTELLAIHEPLEDGAEIMWAKHGPRKLKNIKKLAQDFSEINNSDNS